MADYDYFIHYLFRLGENNLDNLIINSGTKGLGKSTNSISMSIKYLKFFGYRCPSCGKEFYKNLWRLTHVNGTATFSIPQEILYGKWQIRCPDSFELDLKSGLKKKISGCGKVHAYKDLKRVTWRTYREYFSYSNCGIFSLFLLVLYHFIMNLTSIAVGLYLAFTLS